MNKRQIQQQERQGEKRQTQGTAHKASISRQEREEAQGVVIARSSIEALADAIFERLRKHGPLLARLAAADTIRTTEKPDTVFRRALSEAQLARAVIEAAEVAKS